MEKKIWFEENPRKTIIFIILIGLLSLLFATEMFLRYKIHKNMPLKRYIRLKEIPPYTSIIEIPSETYMEGADSLIRKEYELTTDKDGFIEPSKRYENPDKTIVFLGGSTTECAFVDKYNRFPYLSGVLLEQNTGLKINSYNGGVSGNNSLHSLDILLNKVIPMKPDVVVMMENINDLMVLLYEKSYWNDNPSRSPIVTTDPDNLIKVLKTIKNFLIPNLYQKFSDLKTKFWPKRSADEFAHVRGQKIVIDKALKEHLKKEFEMNLQAFISICKIRGITPVLMTQQNRLTTPPDPLIWRTLVTTLKKDFDIEYKDFKEIYDLFNQTIREVGAKNDVMVIDLDKEIPHTKEFMYDLCHFNDKGSKLAAEIISKKLLPIIIKIPE